MTDTKVHSIVTDDTREIIDRGRFDVFAWARTEEGKKTLKEAAANRSRVFAAIKEMDLEGRIKACEAEYQQRERQQTEEAITFVKDRL